MSRKADPVVVGVDGSMRSTGALRWAADEAARRRRALRIVYALASADPRPNDPAQGLVDDGVARAVAWHPRLQVTGVVHHGAPAAELIAESEHAELVVVGCRGRGGVAGLLLGSVSSQVAAHARCPVLVVHHGEIWTGSETPPASGRPVVVGIDGSAAADLAAGFAFEEAAALGVSLVAVRAWHRPRPVGQVDMEPIVADIEEIETAERQLLVESVAAWQSKYPHVPVRLRPIEGSAGAALVTASVEAQLAVVGSRGHGGFLGLLLGSASQQLLHHSHCPVLVVHPH